MTSERSSSPLWAGAVFGALTTAALVGVLALVEPILGTPFLPFDIFDLMARVLPGGLIRFVIASMVAIIQFLQSFLPLGDTSTAAKLAEQAIAVVQFIAAGVVLGLLLAWLQPSRSIRSLGIAAGLLLLALMLTVHNQLGITAGLGSLALGLVYMGWGWLTARLIEGYAQRAEAETAQLTRRQFLAVSGAGLAVTALGAWGASRLFGAQAMPPRAVSTPVPTDPTDPFGARLTNGPAQSPSPQELAARPAPVTGTRPELTANQDFYRIDINTRPPQLDADAWRLQIGGMVETPLEFTLDELRAMPAQTQILTMQCISNPVGGDLTSASRWTGVPFNDVLAMAGVQATAAGAYITSADGFYEFVSMEDIQDPRTMLVYAMNDEPLEYEHGYPLRIYIPNRYGMKQPKWIQWIEMVPERLDGYWVERGWDREAFPQTVSVIDTVVVDPAVGETGAALCGGVAWAGTRGIGRVEVRVDGSEWQPAELIAPPLSALNWILWRFSFPYQMGRRVLEVRAFDASGLPQETRDAPPAPSGATGIHQVVVTI
ncbi:MAG TPA: molybdopterin-dependent oxidoreductase [Anaerolineales bacterium]|nr:molybdopterin-dependent oxidoreductase [Anaerolineales bacterium]HRQ93264.1 molybdopterin-dependent oxidoreductase [Anaerolineales bacterium]